MNLNPEPEPELWKQKLLLKNPWPEPEINRTTLADRLFFYFLRSTKYEVLPDFLDPKPKVKVGSRQLAEKCYFSKQKTEKLLVWFQIRATEILYY